MLVYSVPGTLAGCQTHTCISMLVYCCTGDTSRSPDTYVHVSTLLYKSTRDIWQVARHIPASCWCTAVPMTLAGCQTHTCISMLVYCCTRDTSRLPDINLHQYVHVLLYLVAKIHTCVNMLVHCCTRDTGGLPRLVASCTRSSCSFWAVLSTTECNSATAANQVDNGSMLNSPPHSNWPADTEFAKITSTHLAILICFKFFSSPKK